MSTNETIPSLATKQIRLRPFYASDAEPLQRILAQPGVLRYFPSSDPPPLERVERLIENHRRHWEKNGYGWWAVADSLDGDLVGWCGLGLLDETGEVEVKYLLKPSHWGRGIATEAARASLEFGYRSTDLDEIIGLTHPQNIASQMVLQKIGLTFHSQAEYFGMLCFRYTITRNWFEAA